MKNAKSRKDHLVYLNYSVLFYICMYCYFCCYNELNAGMLYKYSSSQCTLHANFYTLEYIIYLLQDKSDSIHCH
jgi:hypothetical protein